MGYVLSSMILATKLKLEMECITVQDSEIPEQ